MADGAVYGPKSNIFQIGGIPLLVGRGSGTYFTFNYKNPVKWVAETGVDGQGYYVTHNNLSAIMTLVTIPNSEDNDIVSAALFAQDASPIGLRYPLYIQQGLTIYTGTGVVQGHPPLEFSDAATPVTWTFESTRMVGRRRGLPAAPIGTL